YNKNNKYNKNLENQYFEAVAQEINFYKKKSRDCKLLVDTIYFGGGTPSLVDVDNLKLVLKTIKNIFKIKKPEITVEANPNYIDEKYLIELKKIGINRLSFGLQSANDDELYLLGRTHTSQEAKNIIKIAQKVGFKNISVDLILGLPNQTLDKIKNSLDFIKDISVGHVSAYILQIEKNTMFNQKSVIERLPDENLVSKIYLYLVDELKKLGLNQYEISNFAKLGLESKHNLKYWNQEEYIGFGTAAHSFFNNKRYCLENNIYKYIGMAQDKKFNYIFENNKDNNIINEYIFLKLRMSSGIIISEMKNKFPEIFVGEFLSNIKKYYNSEYMFFDEKTIYLKPKGFLIYNTIVSNLMI
ncbi:MAG: radical SAM family heme chaperone HemW, partial [Oscillospiraceae bacterium]|nr:radical SAM family heme chaperone HemW [Oscillospiraceae bacterium]